jgi:hypothetical protein|tara:strand:- start:1180 stop:1395 length:216 start_codon:yes stop_codon:yes gene_type:complete
MNAENKLDELRETLDGLRRDENALYQAIDAFESVCWDGGIREPHHALMEMEDASYEIASRIEEIEDKVSRI